MADDQQDDEQRFVSQGRGRWSEAGLPRKGWTCIGIDDLKAPDHTCEMCQSQAVRYVHHMTHEQSSETLGVGCVCAGNMEGNKAAAVAREKGMKSREGKRARWLTRKWKKTANGNPRLTSQGIVVVVFRKPWGWSASFIEPGRPTLYLRTAQPSEEAAKVAAFDMLQTIVDSRV